ncbi:MAG: response regulator [Spirochaetales bacterium]|nr:response regulator [Spirochaetales bacterium]
MKRISTISARLIFSLLIFSSLIIVLNTGFLFIREYRQGKEMIEKSFQTVKNSHLNAVAESVFNFDERALTLQFQGILSLDNVVYIKLREKRLQGDVIHEMGDSSSKVYSEITFPLIHYSFNGRILDLGDITIRANLESFNRELRDRTLRILLEQIVLIMCLALFLFVLTQRSITRHLSRFAQYANHMDLSRLSEHLELNRPKDALLFRPDELDILEKSLNEMRVRIEQELTHKAELERKNRELEQNYLHAQKIDSLGQLAGGIAHDLNNLLTPIVGLSDLLKRQLSNSRYEESVENIFQAGTKASTLVQQLLTFSRRQKMELSPINLNRVIEGFLPLIMRTLKENITIKTEMAEDLKAINSEKGKIEQILMNLSVNSQDAIKGEGLLLIKTDMVDLDEDSREMYDGLEAGRYVLLTFSDNGIGMDRETVNKIFDPYYSTKGEKGTGLGLATVYGIVMQQKGKILVYSEPGQGTTFKILFPVSEENFTPLRITMDEWKGESDGEGSERILIVEDDDLVRSFTTAILNQQGYRTVAVESGEKALPHLNEPEPFQLLLTDMVMPGMNGRELLEEAQKTHPDIPVLFMSGYADDFLYDEEMEKYNFIQKPFTINQLLEAISRALPAGHNREGESP